MLSPFPLALAHTWPIPNCSHARVPRGFQVAGMIRSIQIAPNNTVYVHNLTAMNNDASSNVIYPRGESTVPISAVSEACRQQRKAPCNSGHVHHTLPSCHTPAALPPAGEDDWPCAPPSCQRPLTNISA